MDRFTLFYTPSNAENNITCGSLQHEVVRVFYADDAPHRRKNDDSDSSDDEPRRAAAPKAQNENMGEDECWGLVERLQWVGRSDRTISSRRFAVVIEDFNADGVLPAIQRAFQTLIASLRLAHPALVSLTQNEIAQLIALGKDIATAAGDTPELLAYAKNEAQPLDLAQHLRL
jgi:hypothetical protein